MGEPSNQLECEPFSQHVLGQERTVETLGFSFQTKEAQSDIVGGTLVSETFTVSSPTTQVKFRSQHSPLGGVCRWAIFRGASARAAWLGVQGSVLVGGADRLSLFLSLQLAGPVTEHWRG